MTLRNFGLSFSRRSARHQAGVMLRPTPRAGIVGLLVLVALLLAWLVGG